MYCTSLILCLVAPAEGPAQTHQSTPGASQPGALVRVEPPLVLGSGRRHNTEHSWEGFGLDIIFISSQLYVSKGFEAEVLITPVYDGMHSETAIYIQYYLLAANNWKNNIIILQVVSIKEIKLLHKLNRCLVLFLIYSPFLGL